MGEKILEKYQVKVLVNWGKPLDFWNGKKYVKRQALADFPALFFISESRIFIMSDYTQGPKLLVVRVGLIPIPIPVSRSKHHVFYMELALDKLEKNPGSNRKIVYFRDNTLYFKPHGQLGRTRVMFKGLPKKFKKEIDEILQKAAALNISAPDAGILITDRPLREVYEERMRIINAKREKTMEPILVQEEMGKPEPEEFAMPTIAYESMMETETVSNEEETKEEKVEPELTLLQKSESSKEPTVEYADLQISEPVFEQEDQQLEKIETKSYYDSGGQSIETMESMEKIWQSLVPRETICPYCKKRVLTMDRKCPHCGAINL
ncbi:MAG: hypothetical protein QXO71_04655 [Candidatus Jordarchaeaceae archaeon]